MAKILLIKPNSDVYCTPIPLGLMYLSSYFKEKGGSHSIKILDGRAENIRDAKRYIEIMSDYRPDIVGISAMHHEAEASRQLATVIKKINKNCVVIIGGAYPTSDYESCLKHRNIDFAVIGEGEETFYEFIDCLENNMPFDNIKGIAYRKNSNIIFNGWREPIKDLNTIPYPDYSQIDINLYFYGSRPVLTNPVYWKKRGVNIITSRGCPYHCTYCHNIFGKKIRFRSVENVLGEISLLKQKYDIEEVEFIDDCFNFDLERAKGILDRLAKSNMDLKVSLPNGFRIDRIDDELVDKLVKADTYKISFGIETAHPRIQSQIKKNIDILKAKKIIKTIAAKGIHTTGFFMLGFPNETEEEMMTTINYALSTSLHTASFHVLIPFPGTEIWREARYRGNQFNNNDGVYTEYDKISVNLSSVSNVRLYQLRRMAYRKFYFNIKRMFMIYSVIKGKKHIIYNVIRIIKLSIKGKRHLFN